LEAVHLACQSLQVGECQAAICGSMSLTLSPHGFVSFSQLGTLSPTGGCKPFDEAADGYARAEGAAVIVLQRLSDAVGDNDRIHAIIRSTGASHGGRNPLGVWAPRRDEQAALIQRVMREGGVAPGAIAYVEAHGTGTHVGDKEELLAISQALG